MTIYNGISTKYKFCICLIFSIIFLRLVNCHGHEHSHDEDEHPPPFKYSREANNDEHHSHVRARETGHAHHSEKLSWASPEPRGNSKFRQWPPRATSPRLGFGLILQALGATLFVSFVPFLVLFVVPVDGSAEHAKMLKVLLSFASGGLLGDAFLHLIPHANMAANAATGDGAKFRHGHSHEDSRHDLSVGLWVLIGIGAFLIVEKALRITQAQHQHLRPLLQSTDAPSSICNSSGRKKQEVKFIDPPSKIHCCSENTSDDDFLDASGDSPRKRMRSDGNYNYGNFDYGHHAPNEIKVAGYLNLVADFIHNFTDGMAIGASFLAGRGIGVITTITVIFHEIPHEIGDFAILLQSGLSRRNAILLQLVTAIGALTGTVCSLLAEGIGELATSWVLGFTAGGFIYIATVTVIPELLKDNQFWLSVQEGIAMIGGILMMVLIARVE